MDGVVATGAVQLQGCNLTVEIASREKKKHNDHRDREEVDLEDLEAEVVRRMMHRGGRGGPPGAPRGGDYNNYMSPQAATSRSTVWGREFDDSGVFAERANGVRYGSRQHACTKRRVGRQSVTDRLDRGDRGRGGGEEEDAIEVLKITMIIITAEAEVGEDETTLETLRCIAPDRITIEEEKKVTLKITNCFVKLSSYTKLKGLF